MRVSLDPLHESVQLLRRDEELEVGLKEEGSQSEFSGSERRSHLLVNVAVLRGSPTVYLVVRPGTINTVVQGKQRFCELQTQAHTRGKGRRELTQAAS